MMFPKIKIKKNLRSIKSITHSLWILNNKQIISKLQQFLLSSFSISSLFDQSSQTTMFSVKASSAKKRKPDPEIAKSDHATKRSSSKDLDLDFDLDLDLSKFVSSKSLFQAIFVFVFWWFGYGDLRLVNSWWNFSDIKGIMSALQQIRAKAQKDGQKKNEETISRSDSNRFCLFICYRIWKKSVKK